jgi:YfiH family protein
MVLEAETHDVDPFFPLTTSGALAGIAPRHAFTTRALRFRDESAAADWAELSRHIDTPEDRIVRVSQVHGRRVLVIDQKRSPWRAMEGHGDQADSIVCTDQDLAVAVRVADCVPILIADKKHRVVAAVHAGWRGTCAGVATATIEAIDELGMPPGDLVATIGPSMGGCCYQVGDSTRDTFLGMTPDAVEWFTEDGPGHWKLDLWRANADQLIAAGVPAESIHVMGVCTKDQHDRCWSYRMDGAGAGRMVAAIRIGHTSPHERQSPEPSPRV